MGKLSSSDKGVQVQVVREEKSWLVAPGTALRHRVAFFHVLIPGREWIPAFLLFHQLQEVYAYLQIGPCSNQVEGDGQGSRIADSSQLTATEDTELHQASKKAWICMVSIDSCSITSSVDKEENRFWWTRRNL